MPVIAEQNYRSNNTGDLDIYRLCKVVRCGFHIEHHNFPSAGMLWYEFGAAIIATCIILSNALFVQEKKQLYGQTDDLGTGVSVSAVNSPIRHGRLMSQDQHRRTETTTGSNEQCLQKSKVLLRYTTN